VRAVVCDHLLASHRIDLAAQLTEARDHWVRSVLDRVVLAPESVRVEITSEQVDACREALAAAASRKHNARETPPSQTCPFTPEVEATPCGVALALRLQIKRLDGKRMLLSPDGHGLVACCEPSAAEHIRTAIGRAFAYRDELQSTGGTIRQLAERIGLTESRVNRVLLLTRLSPAILKRALSGTLPPGIGIDDLIAAAYHVDWSRQAKRLHI
jgi:hypothetical protein